VATQASGQHLRAETVDRRGERAGGGRRMAPGVRSRGAAGWAGPV